MSSRQRLATASPAPVDIGYDTKRKRLLMPGFDDASDLLPWW